MSENNEAILQAIQAGFANNERQFTDLIASNSRLENTALPDVMQYNK